jgi:gliding motility-associated lipoprotein GldH
MKLVVNSILLLLLAGCNSAKVMFEEHHSVGEDMTWETSEPITFEIDIKENKHPYEMAVAIRYAHGFPFNKLPIQMTETNPQGGSVRRDLEIMIQPKPGEYLGEKGFDIIDLEQIIDTEKEFPTFGKYTYTLVPVDNEEHGFPLIMEIGLVLKDTAKH